MKIFLTSSCHLPSKSTKSILPCSFSGSGQETAAADERIAQVERKRQASLESIEQIYSENKDRWIDELFHAIID